MQQKVNNVASWGFMFDFVAFCDILLRGICFDCIPIN